MRNFVAVHVRNSSRKVGRQPKHWMELTMFAHDRVRFLGLSHLSGFEIHPSMHVSCLSHVTCTDWLRKGSCTWLKGLPILSAMPHITLWEVSQEHGRKLLACWKLYDDVDGKYVCATSVFEVRRLCKNLFVEAIDKNNSEFVCMCPRMYHLLACGLFQFYIPGVFLIGASYRATIPFRAYCRRRCKFCFV